MFELKPGAQYFKDKRTAQQDTADTKATEPQKINTADTKATEPQNITLQSLT